MDPDAETQCRVTDEVWGTLEQARLHCGQLPRDTDAVEKARRDLQRAAGQKPTINPTLAIVTIGEGREAAGLDKLVVRSPDGCVIYDGAGDAELEGRPCPADNTGCDGL